MVERNKAEDELSRIIKGRTRTLFALDLQPLVYFKFSANLNPFFT